MTPSQFIADLYELKATLIRPINFSQTYAEPNITYAVIQTLIATFSDKYKVRFEDIEDELRKRSIEKITNQP